MLTKAAIEFFGSQKAVARALGIQQPSVAEWGEYPPDLRQIQMQMLSNGKLKAEPECMPAKAAKLAANVQVSRHELRPDIFGKAS